MTGEEARKVHLAASVVAAHLRSDVDTRDDLLSGTEETVAQTINDASDGFILLAVAVAGIVANLTGDSFESVLANLHERDEELVEGQPQMWVGILDQVLHVQAGQWPGPSELLDVPTALTTGFNVAVALLLEFGEVSGQSAAVLAESLAAQAATEM